MTLTDQVINSLAQEPQRWHEDSHHLKNENKGVKLWSCNSWIFITVSASPKGVIRLGLVSKWRIGRAIKRWRRVPL